MSVTAQSTLRPLTDVKAGDHFMVEELVFDIVRQMCPPIGFTASDVLTCVSRTARDLTLRTANGSDIVVDRFYAAFVAVRMLNDDGQPQPVRRQATTSRPGGLRL
jgi:hypothetical protein